MKHKRIYKDITVKQKNKYTYLQDVQSILNVPLYTKFHFRDSKIKSQYVDMQYIYNNKPISNHPKNISEKGYRCVCLNARSIVNKKNELNIMVEDIDPHIIGITESWANIDITDAELGLTGYVMFRKDRIGRRGGGVILYVKESIQAYEIKLEREADCDEAVWCKIVSGNSKLTIGLVYRSPNINEEDNTKIKTTIK